MSAMEIRHPYTDLGCQIKDVARRLESVGESFIYYSNEIDRIRTEPSHTKEHLIGVILIIAAAVFASLAILSVSVPFLPLVVTFPVYPVGIITISVLSTFLCVVCIKKAIDFLSRGGNMTPETQKRVIEQSQRGIHYLQNETTALCKRIQEGIQSVQDLERVEQLVRDRDSRRPQVITA